MNTNEIGKYMPDSVLPPPHNRDANSTHRLSRRQVQIAMADAKRFIEKRLENDLHLIKHAAPIAFLRGTGVNDELDGTESKSAVRFGTSGASFVLVVYLPVKYHDISGQSAIHCARSVSPNHLYTVLSGAQPRHSTRLEGRRQQAPEEPLPDGLRSCAVAR